MEAKKQAGRSPAAFFAEWPLSDPAMRPTRSVTASAQALDHSLPGKPERSLPPLGLLPHANRFAGFVRGPERRAYPASGGRGGCPHPPAGRRRVQENAAAGRRGRAATRAAPTARVEDSCRGPMRAEGELPRRGKSGCPGVSAPTEDIFKGYNVGAGLVPARGAGRPRFWLQSAAREGPP